MTAFCILMFLACSEMCIRSLFIMAQYAKHYEQKSDSSNAHTLNSSSAIIEQHTMSNLASLDLYAPVRNITSSRDIHPIYFMTKD
ncbi:hypothetical protein [Staphylococcus aureus]|uniref:hypothetical protein n=1 Tax=Staphylococcus aureus TaxID=1280 RepID=UPI003D18E81E